MKKNGFTLIELLVVIAIIAILSVVVIPSVMTVNKNVNERLYKQKIENIESAAELFASNNPDIFNGADRIKVYVYQLIDANYLEIDTKYETGNCKSKKADGSDVPAFEMGCITDPRNDVDDNIMNLQEVLLVKKNIGVTATVIVPEDGDGPSTANSTLVNVICDRFANGTYLGLYDTGGVNSCRCNDTHTDLVSLDVDGNEGDSVNICMITSTKDSGDVDNWLKYGSTQANWRVLGLYKINGVLYPKMITSDVVQ